MSFSFLVDVNLPKYFSFFNDNRFVFVSDIDLQMSDTEIWDYASSFSWRNKIKIAFNGFSQRNIFWLKPNLQSFISLQLKLEAIQDLETI